MLKLDWNVIINMINIFVLYILMKKFLFGPITEMMEKRKNMIEASLLEVENKNNEALLLKQKCEEELENADIEALSIIKEAKQKALEVHDYQIKATKEETIKMFEEANKSIELEKKQSMQDIQSEIASLALVAAAKIIQKDVDNSTNKRLINDFLNEAGAGK